ncbi:FadR/GntR family transcriptional regulator [Salisediminibacterium beveridgei]|uniref:Transcriptional regulator, GntR family n=1 Tax=Salisediminibacterium beveridgei TaxID=632773 RepID=A0A1D7QTB1_9BACI|nr:FadR/GntR family transcriptional regulator [Salisediminibacterium beveridgei]AOM82254.1 Transcriptional regulator, GntR family [Salisediminibacterium beveridgei]
MDKVYMNILKAIDEIIEEDGLIAGDKLPSERELAERLDAGRSSVREAFRALELLDLIETRKGEGTFVKQPGSHRLAELLAGFFLREPKARQDLSETRRIIEAEAVRLACERHEAWQLVKLKELIEEARNGSEEGDVPVEEDYAFHKMLVQSGNNQLMLNIWRPLVAYSKAALKSSLEREGRIEKALREHELIVEAIEKRDADAAVSALLEHLENSEF